MWQEFKSIIAHFRTTSGMKNKKSSPGLYEWKTVDRVTRSQKVLI